MKEDHCPNCLGLFQGAEIKRNPKDFQECLECPVFNGVEVQKSQVNGKDEIVSGTLVWHNPALAASKTAAKVDSRLAKVAKQVEKERRNGFDTPVRKVNWRTA